MKSTIHWLGVGLSATPGIKYLSNSSHNLVVWNRRTDKAQTMLDEANIQCELKQLDWSVLAENVKSGDILVSMLPANMHVEVAQLCLDKSAHFVSSSYIAPEMRALDQQAKAKGLTFINEIGLDPGIDHLFAHLLVARFKESEACNAESKLYFRSYCGGFPKTPNDFKYKFSWSPLGVLKALTSPAKWLENGVENNSKGPWEALKDIHISAVNETFQAYPNRDSIPFVKQYEFEPEWQVEEFVRGTLRLNGWSQAWQYLFDQVGDLQGEAGLAKMEAISKDLEDKYSYEEGEPDRVVMSVELEAKQADNTVWHQRYYMDAAGNNEGQAMARLVSITVALGIEAVINGDIPAGVHAAPSQPDIAQQWLDKLSKLGQSVHIEQLV
ncbi:MULTISPECIES: saccharopine dehydrogenase family protein [Thalassotalea]|uniref:saccharopine dehydrogenase family protein n=1 Tax=Thalassotalea TaxID=1518149 RepID=UPI000945731D|nr:MULTISPECIES: saccharopine dehydrogenase family protein [Thalassotalea]OKY26183.1 saccharopine dehydrogenase [Thalassotalea sp. PP2-459]